MDQQRRLDRVDGRIVALFEKRMALIKEAAEEVDKRVLKQQRRMRGADAADKAARHTCDVEVIGYTEELIEMMLCAAEKYQRRLVRIRLS